MKFNEAVERFTLPGGCIFIKSTFREGPANPNLELNKKLFVVKHNGRPALIDWSLKTLYEDEPMNENGQGAYWHACDPTYTVQSSRFPSLTQKAGNVYGVDDGIFYAFNLRGGVLKFMRLTTGEIVDKLPTGNIRTILTMSVMLRCLEVIPV